MARVAVMLGALAIAGGCVASPPLQAQPASQPGAARRSNVAPVSIGLSADVLRVAPGESVVVTARPRGGEAMLFSVDWVVEEGSVGGTLVAKGRKDDGSYDATYTAPATGAGTFHISATIREYPSAVARARIDVQPRR